MANLRMTSEAIKEISEHEKKLYDLRNSEVIHSIFKEGLSLDLDKDVDAMSISEDGTQLVIELKGRPEITMSAEGDDIMPESIKTRFYNLIFHASSIWRCLGHMPLWYRYWVFRYLESRSLEGLEQMSRIAPQDLEADFAITAIVPSMIAASSTSEMKNPQNIVKRLTLVQTSQDDVRNQATGEIYPFIIMGTKFGFNQAIPMPYYQEHINAREDIEPVESGQLPPLWSV